MLAALANCTTKNVVKSFYPCDESVFWWAVMQAESGGNPLHIYNEPPPLNQESIGLFQLSTTDSSYGCSKVRADYFDPKKNTACKDLIVKGLRAKYPSENWSQALGRYWSTLRSPKEWPNARTEPFKNFKYYAEKKGCEI
jgi:hypothetical protein